MAPRAKLVHRVHITPGVVGRHAINRGCRDQIFVAVGAWPGRGRYPCLARRMASGAGQLARAAVRSGSKGCPGWRRWPCRPGTPPRSASTWRSREYRAPAPAGSENASGSRRKPPESGVAGPGIVVLHVIAHWEPLPLHHVGLLGIGTRLCLLFGCCQWYKRHGSPRSQRGFVSPVAAPCSLTSTFSSRLS